MPRYLDRCAPQHMVTEVIVIGNGKAVDRYWGVLKMASSPLKRKAPLQESQSERKKSKLSNREKHVFVSK